MGAKSPGEESCWDLCCEPTDGSSQHVEFVDDRSHAAHLKKRNKLTQELTDVENTQEVLDIRFKRNTEDLLETLDQEKEQTEKEIKEIEKQRKNLEEQVLEWKKQRDQYEDTLLKEVQGETRDCHPGCLIA